MKVEIWWEGISGYAASCWRSLNNYADVELNVIAVELDESANTAFSNGIARELPVVTVSNSNLDSLIKDRVANLSSGLLMVSGWNRSAYRKYISSAKKPGLLKILSFDTPWTGSLRDHIRVLLLARYASKFDGAFVPGERSFQFARRLGFLNKRIFKGLYSVDTDLLVSTFEKRCTKPWPKKFLYVGRYIEEKDLRTLAEGYRIYRSLVKDPWPLSTIGQGPHRKLLEDQIGVDVLDFVQPDDLAVFWERHGAFVIASKYDPWPLVIVEACRAGLPVIHSTACGSAVELVRESYSGYSFPTGSAIGLALAMTKIHHRYDDLRTMGKRSIQLSSPYCSRQWAMNVLEIAWFLEGCKAY